MPFSTLLTPPEPVTAPRPDERTAFTASDADVVLTSAHPRLTRPAHRGDPPTSHDPTSTAWKHACAALNTTAALPARERSGRSRGAAYRPSRSTRIGRSCNLPSTIQ